MLTQAIDDYLAIRRAAGFRLAVTEALLRNYARFAAVRSETLIRSETVLAWAARAPSPPQRGRRLEVLSIFARHVHAEDPRHEIPPKGVFPACRPSYTPFIYTPAQIGALLARTAQLPPAGSLRPWTYCTLFTRGDWAAHFRGTEPASRRCHGGWPVDSRDQVPQEPTGSFASECRCRAGTLP